MYDHVAVVQQQPAGSGRSFIMYRQFTGLFQRLQYFGADGPELPLAFPAAHDKIVREAAHFPDIQQYYIIRLLVGSRIDSQTG